MSKTTVLSITLLLVLTGCSLPFRTATVVLSGEDRTDPEILEATFTVLGPEGRSYDLDDVSRVGGAINIEQALTLNFVAQDRESGIRTVHLSGEFVFWCGSTGIEPEMHWPIIVTDSSPPASVGERVRVTAGVSRRFAIATAYDETPCPNPPPRFQDLRGAFTLTATNHAGRSISRSFALTITPSRTGVTVLDR